MDLDPLRKARDLMHLGDYSAAKHIYEDLSRNDPENEPVHFQLGLCYSADRDFQRALHEFESCIKLDPTHLEAHIELGDLYFKLGDDSRALEYLQKSCEIDPENVRARTYLARLYEHTGNYDHAIRQYKKAIEGSEANESPRHDLALAYIHNGDLLDGYLILQELVDEADLGLLWSRINKTEQDLAELNVSATADYISMLKDDMDTVESRFFEKYGYSIRYTKGMLDALERFLQMEEQDILKVRNEIRMLIHLGVGFSGDTERFELQSMPGRFSGFQLGCYLFTSEQLTRSESRLPGSYEEAFAQALTFLQHHQ